MEILNQILRVLYENKVTKKVSKNNYITKFGNKCHKCGDHNNIHSILLDD